jgi:PAS domain S-box-containing protein
MPALDATGPQRFPSAPLTAYAWGLGCVALATLLRWWIDPLLGDHLPLLTYFGAIIAIAASGHLGPSIAVLVLGAWAADFFFAAPRHTWVPHMTGTENHVERVGYLAVGLISIAFGQSLHRARWRADVGREQLRVTLASIGDAVITTDLEGRVLTMNAVAEQLSGWPAAEARGSPLGSVLRLLNEHTRAPVENPARRVLAEGVVVGLANHTVLVARDGTERAISDSAAPIRRGGEVIGVVLIFRDATEARRAEQRLRESEERFRALVHAAAHIVWTTDAEGRALEELPAWSEYTGQSEEQRRRVGPLEVIHPDDREAAARAWNEAVAARAPYEAEYRLKLHDGSYRWTAARAVPLRDSAGHHRGWVGMHTDVHEQHVAAAALRENQDRLRMSLAAARMRVWDWDLRAERVESERTGLDSFAAERGWELVLPEDRERVRAEIAAALAGADQYTTEIRTVHASTGETLWLEVIGRIIRDDGGAPVRVVGTSRDITERKRFEAALREADQRKNEFLATLAHELRNPLAPLANTLELMKRAGPEPDWLADARMRMERQVSHLVRLVDDLLDITRITRNRLTLRKERVELGSLLHQSLDALRPRIEAGRHPLGLELPGRPLYLEADPVRLVQVFTNLLDNACKYSEPQRPLHVAVDERPSEVQISFRDAGIGIAAEHLPRVFEMFSQAGSPIDRTQGGLGIGLSLVRALVELHGGSITARSAGIGKGAEFTVRLPVAPHAQAAAKIADAGAGAPASAGRWKVLVADDNRDSAESMAVLLRRTGHEVEVAHDGLEAVALAARFAPHAALLDIGMPALNGLEACRRIRAQPGGSAIVIIAMTGWGQVEDRQRAIEAGFDHHLTKPVHYDTLNELLAAARSRKA